MTLKKILAREILIAFAAAIIFFGMRWHYSYKADKDAKDIALAERQINSLLRETEIFDAPRNINLWTPSIRLFKVFEQYELGNLHRSDSEFFYVAVHDKQYLDKLYDQINRDDDIDVGNTREEFHSKIQKDLPNGILYIERRQYNWSERVLNNHTLSIFGMS